MKYPIIFSFLVLFVACSSTKNNKTSQTEKPVKETVEKTPNMNVNMRLNDIWALENVDFAEQKFDAKSFQRRPVIEFHLNDMKIMGNDGCNEMFGKIAKIEGNKIEFGSIGGTKKYCPENMEFTNTYKKALAATTAYKLADLKLLLFDENRKEILRFQKVD